MEETDNFWCFFWKLEGFYFGGGLSDQSRDFRLFGASWIQGHKSVVFSSTEKNMQNYN